MISRHAASSIVACLALTCGCVAPNVLDQRPVGMTDEQLEPIIALIDVDEATGRVTHGSALVSPNDTC